MADFAARAQVAADAGFRGRVAIALARVAVAVTSEALPKPTWTRKRVSLAEAVLRDPGAMANRFALIVASRDVGLTASDVELEVHVRDAWDAVAGVGLEDRG